MEWLWSSLTWLDEQGGGTQGLVLLALGGAGAVLRLVWQAFRRSQAVRRLKQEAQAERQRKVAEELAADFRHGDAPLGSVDHAVRVFAAPEAVRDLVSRVVPLVLEVEQQIVRGTRRFPPGGASNHLIEKQRIERKVALAIHPSIRETEEIAAAYEEHTKAFVGGFRHLIANTPLRGDADAASMLELPKNFSGGFADAFRLGAKAMRDRLNFIRAMHGFQQDLTRMTQRQAVSLKRIAVCSSRIARFCDEEMPRLVDARLRKESRKAGRG